MNFIKEQIRDIKDFPKAGIVFKDITPLLNNAEAFKKTIDAFEKALEGKKVDRIVGVESRGFIFGAPLAERIGAGFVLARKPGKLPAKTVSESFKLEYGEDSLEIHEDAINKGEKVVIIDDVLATGGTMSAVVNLVNKLGGDIERILLLMELSFLNGHEKLVRDGKDVPRHALIKY
jgi:adenine phosphoribosyltransferase